MWLVNGGGAEATQKRDDVFFRRDGGSAQRRRRRCRQFRCQICLFFCNHLSRNRSGFEKWQQRECAILCEKQALAARKKNKNHRHTVHLRTRSKFSGGGRSTELAGLLYVRQPAVLAGWIAAVLALLKPRSHGKWPGASLDGSGRGRGQETQVLYSAGRFLRSGRPLTGMVDC